MRKRARALTGAIVLALGLIAAPVAGADEALPERATVSLWAGIEAWFQDLLSGWIGLEPDEAPTQTDRSISVPIPELPGSSNDGGSGGSTTDEGGSIDPDG